MDSIFLSLRNNRHQFKAVKRPGGPGTMLARFYPQQSNQRATVVEQWGTSPRSARQLDDITINIPISQREQTVMNAAQPWHMRDLLAGDALLPPVQSRREMTQARAPRVPSHLDRSISALSVCPDRRCRHGR